jgi:hypothetical protein
MEIDRTVGAIRLTRPLDLICLTGASCALDGIEKIFQSHFEVETTRVDLSARYGVKEDRKAKGETSASLQGATVIGLALKALGVDNAKLDFRKDEFAQQGKLEPFKRGAACTLCLLFALSFVWAFGLKQSLREKRARLDGVRKVQESLFTVLFPSLDGPGNHKQELAPGDWYQSLLAEQRRLSETYGSGNPIPGGTTSALEVLKAFGEAKSKLEATWQVEMTKANVNPRDTAQSTFSCMSPHQQAPVAFEQKFENAPLVTGGFTNARQDPRTSKWLFDMVVKVKKPQGSN